MTRVLIGRLGGLIGVLLALTFAVFIIKAVLPADPVPAPIGSRAPEAPLTATSQQPG